VRFEAGGVPTAPGHVREAEVPRPLVGREPHDLAEVGLGLVQRPPR
jgi:hypothetical protein